jgi:glycosyltransferase involved in cell wall biosynthesis
MTPTVTFVVPCYKLAHFLPECVRSILVQSYEDFEILIMDDCSPDDTPSVAASFRDARVRHVRQAQNVGHLRNYNHGIELGRGKYVWLISPDDYLRRTDALVRFVGALDAHENVGFVFSPAVGVEDGRETGVLPWSAHGPADIVLPGHRFLVRFLTANGVAAAAGMARKRCYEHSLFPLDLPYTGDWYLWCRFALHDDVAYVADPMVCYRKHGASMTVEFSGPRVKERIANEIAIRWRIMRDAERVGHAWVVKTCVDKLVEDYVRRVAWKQQDDWSYGLALDEFDQSVAANAKGPREAGRIRSRVFSGLGDHYYWGGDREGALTLYRAAMAGADPRAVDLFAKYAFSRMGRFGSHLRQAVARVQRGVTGRLRSHS